jgi:hypothetical protein
MTKETKEEMALLEPNIQEVIRELMDSLKDAHDLLLAIDFVAQREGIQTNWGALKSEVNAVRLKQSRLFADMEAVGLDLSKLSKSKDLSEFKLCQ